MSSYTEIPKIIAETGELPPKVLGDLNSRYPGASSQSVEYFVAPPPLGDDEHDGSEDYPFATIAAAVAKLPDMIRSNHHHHIILQPGDYPEDVRIANKVAYGRITIGGQTNERDRYRLRSLIFDRVYGQATMENIVSTVDDVEGSRSFEVRASGPMIFARNISATPDQGGPLPETRGFLADYGSTVRITGSDFSGKRYGVRSNYQSQIYLTSSNTGSGNDIGVAARWGATLSAHYGGLPDGGIPTSVNSGGIITLGHGQVLGDRPENGLAGEISYRGSDPIQKTWALSNDSISQYVPGGIPAGSLLQLRFRTPPVNNVPMTIDVEWVSQSALTAGQGVRALANVMFRNNAFATKTVDIINSSQGMSSSVDVEARGSFYDFYININGARGEADNWLCVVKITTPDPSKMPLFAQAQVLPSV